MKLGEVIIIKVVAFLFERFTKRVNSTALVGTQVPPHVKHDPVLGLPEPHRKPIRWVL